MASSSRTLTLKLLADIDNFQKNLKNADNDVSGFSGGLQKFGKVAGAAFLAAGVAAAGYAAKLAIDGVKAAIEDEAAQAKLAKTLENVTGATDDQIKSLENYILQTSLAFNVTDDDLRPSLDRLVRSTKNVEEAQKLQTLALNIAAGTGKSLTQVSEALAKAHDGNFTALKRLGGGIDESIIKSKDFDAATAALAKTFEGQASAQADTFQGKLGRLQIAFNEGKETIGSFILDAITPMVTLIVEQVVPVIQAFASGLGGKGGLKEVFDDYINAAKKIFIPIFEGLKNAFNDIKDAVMRNKDEFKILFDFLKNTVAPLFGGALKIAIEGIGIALGVVIDVLATFIRYINNAYNAVKKLIDFVKNNPITRFFSGASFEGSSSPNVSQAGFLTASVPSAPDTSAAISNSAIITSEQDRAVRGYGVNINVTGAIDPESTARQIVGILNNSQYRGTGGANGLVF